MFSRRVAAAVCVAVVAVAVACHAALVPKIPGLVGPAMPSKLYAGYITVDQATGRSLYYMYAEAATNPATAPLALWQTGGPGCSSLSALFVENGPKVPAHVPFLLTEYNGGLTTPWMLYSSYSAAFVFRNVALLDGVLDVWSWWTFSDLFEESFAKKRSGLL